MIVRLEEVKKDVKYIHKPTGRICEIVACCWDDGACLIANLWEPDGSDVTSDVVMTEAYELELAP